MQGITQDDRRTLYERLEGKVLVVIVDHKDKAKNIYGTVRWIWETGRPS